MSEQEKPGTGHNHPKRGGEEVRYVPVEYMDQGYRDEDEISLIDLIKVLWDGRKKIIICTGLFFMLGLFVFLFSERQFESEAILIHEQQQMSQAQRQLQRFGGVGDGAQQPQGTIPTSLYPRIMESADFMLAVVTHEVEFKEPAEKMTALTYFHEYYERPLTERTADFVVDYTIKLPITLYRGVRGLFSSRGDDIQELPEEIQRDERFLDLTSAERRAISQMRGRINLDQSGNLNTFKVLMPDARAAAELNEFVIDKIQEYVIDYRIQKYRENLEFVEQQKEQARGRYEEAQMELARFNDRNVNITTSVARTQQEDLQNRRNITYNVFNNLAQELEESRTRLQEETPVFNVLQRPNLPHSMQGGSQLVVILSIFMGAFFGVFLVFGLQAWNVVKDSLES